MAVQRAVVGRTLDDRLVPERVRHAVQPDRRVELLGKLEHPARGVALSLHLRRHVRVCHLRERLHHLKQVVPLLAPRVPCTFTRSSSTGRVLLSINEQVNTRSERVE